MVMAGGARGRPAAEARFVRQHRRALSERGLVSDLVTVFESADVVMFALAKSALDRAGIRYIAQGEGLQDLFGMGRIGAGFNAITGPPRIRVTADNAKRASAILAEITPGEA